MMDNEKAAVIVILEQENRVLDQVLGEQAKLRIAVTRKDWIGLQNCILSLQKLTDSFVSLEEKRSCAADEASVMSIPEAAPAIAQVRSKLLKSKVENKALGDYVHITRGFLQNVLDSVVPQRRNTLYSRKGTIVKPQPESVVLDKLF